MDIRVNLSKPLNDAWIHGVAYYKLNSLKYQRFAVDLWENPCDWLAGKKSRIMDWTFGRVIQYTNINHLCPYDGQIYLKVDNVSIHNFPMEPLVPAGRFRLDVNVTDGTKKHVLAITHLYISVSDHRVEQF